MSKADLKHHSYSLFFRPDIVYFGLSEVEQRQVFMIAKGGKGMSLPTPHPPRARLRAVTSDTKMQIQMLRLKAVMIATVFGAMIAVSA